ncbi:MAG TPA: lytic transglycosylase domain-containing protein [Solirubrobacteraceae bacterium]|jgi:soluble lytic murein transglycosylase|nr:lytic transglycosylase domain-containing protein [Solirubrobacteraceae bacterium]
MALAAVAVLIAVPPVERFVRELSFPLRDTAIINRQAAAEHLDPALIAAVIYAESKFDPRTSPAGALGLMQVEPSTARLLAHMSDGTEFTVADLAHPATNIAYGSYYLRYLLNRFHGSRMLALAAYNAGPTNVDTWVARARADGRALSIATIPFPQTRAYVAKVEAAENTYRRYYPKQLGPP